MDNTHIYNIERKYIRPCIKKYGRAATRRLLSKLQHGTLPVGYPPLDTLPYTEMQEVAEVGMAYLDKATKPQESTLKGE